VGVRPRNPQPPSRVTGTVTAETLKEANPYLYQPVSMTCKAHGDSQPVTTGDKV